MKTRAAKQMQTEKRSGKRLCLRGAVFALSLCLLCSACSGSRAGKAQPMAASLADDVSPVAKEGVVLYFPEADSGQTGIEVRFVLMPQNESLAKKVVELCLQGPLQKNHERLFPDKTAVEGFRVVQGVATIDLSTEALALSDQKLFYAKMCLVNALCALPEIRYVRLTVDGKEVERAFLGEPIAACEGNLEVLWLERNRSNERVGKDKQNVVLYFADRQKSFLLSEVHELSYDPFNKGSALLQDLLRGTRDRTTLTAALPEGMTVSEVLYEQIQEVVGGEEKKVLVNVQPIDETGRYLESNAVVRLSQTAHAFSREEFEKDFIAIGALVMSVLDNMPGIHGVRIEVDKEPIRNLAAHDGADNTLFTQTQFDGLMGTSIVMYYPDEEMETLRRIYRAIPSDDAYRPAVRLRSLLTGPTMMEQQRYGVINPFGDGFENMDMVGVVPINRTLYINVSHDMVTALTSGSIESQVLMTYAVINTLTEMEQYNSVQFVEYGVLPKREGAYLSLEYALIRNPGLIWGGGEP